MSIPLQQEYDVFLSHLDIFVSNHMNEFVLIKGEKIVSFFKTYEDALKEGLAQFGNVPFFIKVVKKEEEVHFFHQGLS
jgi:hypothetical protein